MFGWCLLPLWNALLFAGFGVSLLMSFINSGIQNIAQRAVWMLHYFETVSKHIMSLIRISAVIMFYYHSNNSMTHFTFSCVNPGISIYNTETNMDWNIMYFSPLAVLSFLFTVRLVVTLISPTLKVFFFFFSHIFPMQQQVTSVTAVVCMCVCLNECKCVSENNYRHQRLFWWIPCGECLVMLEVISLLTDYKYLLEEERAVIPLLWLNFVTWLLQCNKIQMWVYSCGLSGISSLKWYHLLSALQ